MGLAESWLLRAGGSLGGRKADAGWGPWWEGKGGEEGDEGEGEARRVKEEFQASESILVRFPPSHTAARVQTDAVISILMHFRGPCPNCSENQKSRVYLQLSL